MNRGDRPVAGEGVRTVERALAVLRALAEERHPLGVAELSSRLHLPQATIHRLLATLTSAGWVGQDPLTLRYGLGTAVLGVGGAALANSPLLQQAGPLLNDLSATTGYSSFLSVLVGRRITYLYRARGEYTRPFDFVVGASQPAHSTADGKLLLAYLSSEERHRTFSQVPELRAYTALTITGADELELEFERIRKQGYAVDRGERYENWYGAAVPVLSADQQVIAAILCGGENEEAASLDLDAFAGAMLRVAEELSHRLGRSYD